LILIFLSKRSSKPNHAKKKKERIIQRLFIIGVAPHTGHRIPAIENLGVAGVRTPPRFTERCGGLTRENSPTTP
jgi:hypothetical protein